MKSIYRRITSISIVIFLLTTFCFVLYNSISFIFGGITSSSACAIHNFHSISSKREKQKAKNNFLLNVFRWWMSRHKVQTKTQNRKEKKKKSETEWSDCVAKRKTDRWTYAPIEMRSRTHNAKRITYPNAWNKSLSFIWNQKQKEKKYCGGQRNKYRYVIKKCSSNAPTWNSKCHRVSAKENCAGIFQIKSRLRLRHEHFFSLFSFLFFFRWAAQWPQPFMNQHSYRQMLHRNFSKMKNKIKIVNFSSSAFSVFIDSLLTCLFSICKRESASTSYININNNNNENTHTRI